MKQPKFDNDMFFIYTALRYRHSLHALTASVYTDFQPEYSHANESIGDYYQIYSPGFY